MRTTIFATLFLTYASSALAAGGNCPTAPLNYDAASCSAFCARNPSDNTQFLCDITAQPGDNAVVVVKNYRPILIAGTQRYSAWGSANGAAFCCTTDSTAAAPVNSVKVLTGDGDDEIWFTAFHTNGSVRNLNSNTNQTVTGRFTGYAYPGEGDDYVQGSNSKASDYRDYLTGEDGRDTIHGNKGPDFISVAQTRVPGVYSANNDGESVYGDNGRDEIEGATNSITAADTIIVSGGAQNDLLCTGPVSYLTGQRVIFLGGDGDDEIYSYSSFIAGNDGAIYGEAGSDGCDNPGGSPETTCERPFTPSNFTAWSPLVCN